MRELFVSDPKQRIAVLFSEVLKPGIADTLVWAGIILLHAATVPSLLAYMAGITDKLPSVDIILFMWASLLLFFIKAAIMRDMVNLITIGIGFSVQATLMALILFK